MNSASKKMILGPEYSQASLTDPTRKKSSNETSLVPKVGTIQEDLKASMATLNEKERSRTKVLFERHQILLHVNEELEPIHERCRTRNMKIFGFVHYGHLLHVGISKIRALSPPARLRLINQCTAPKVTGKPKPLLITRACFLDYQLLWIQVREELWVEEMNRSFGMPELIRMVDLITSEMTEHEIRREYVRISVRKLD